MKLLRSLLFLGPRFHSMSKHGRRVNNNAVVEASSCAAAVTCRGWQENTTYWEQWAWGLGSRMPLITKALPKRQNKLQSSKSCHLTLVTTMYGCTEVILSIFQIMAILAMHCIQWSIKYLVVVWRLGRQPISKPYYSNTLFEQCINTPSEG